MINAVSDRIRNIIKSQHLTPQSLLYKSRANSSQTHRSGSQQKKTPSNAAPRRQRKNSNSNIANNNNDNKNSNSNNASHAYQTIVKTPQRQADDEEDFGGMVERVKRKVIDELTPIILELNQKIQNSISARQLHDKIATYTTQLQSRISTLQQYWQQSPKLPNSATSLQKKYSEQEKISTQFQQKLSQLEQQQAKFKIHFDRLTKTINQKIKGLGAGEFTIAPQTRMDRIANLKEIQVESGDYVHAGTSRTPTINVKNPNNSNYASNTDYKNQHQNTFENSQIQTQHPVYQYTSRKTNQSQAFGIITQKVPIPLPIPASTPSLSLAPTNPLLYKCKCQQLIQEILESQAHLMMELKYIKHFQGIQEKFDRGKNRDREKEWDRNQDRDRYHDRDTEKTGSFRLEYGRRTTKQYRF